MSGKPDAFELHDAREPEVREEEFLIQEEDVKSGHPLKLVLKHFRGLGGRPNWTEVYLSWDHEPKWLVAAVPLEVLERIASLAKRRAVSR